MKKPCNGCQHAYAQWPNLKNKGYTPSLWLDECCSCEKIKKYNDYLESRRKYSKGDVITDIAELCRRCDEDKFVYWNNKILHKGFVYSWQLHMIMMSLKQGCFRVANLKTEHSN